MKRTALRMGMRIRIALCCAVATIWIPPPAQAQGGLNVLDRYRGRWDVTVKIKHPRPAQVTYTETYDWVLDRRFMRGDSGRKSDGSQEIVMATYDRASKGYPFWI